jgi:hypothetical protein
MGGEPGIKTNSYSLYPHLTIIYYRCEADKKGTYKAIEETREGQDV